MQSAPALACFLVVLACNVLGLICDCYLLEAGLPTVSARARQYVGLAICICLWQQLGTIALVVHLYA